MSSSFTRRKFIRSSVIVSSAFLGLKMYACVPGKDKKDIMFKGYGPLKADTEGILNLPEGFSYRIISQMGQPMHDGLISPGRNDAMGTFTLGDKVAIIRNHEITPDDQEMGAFGKDLEHLTKVSPDRLYDFGNSSLPSLGGTTTMIYNESTGKVEKEFMSLAGTIRNCAGGPTPWNSWISCEETTVRKGDYDGMLEQDHGYNFEVPISDQPGLTDPLPLKAMGRFNHEAVAVDPRTGIVYQTEDRNDGLIYRFIPNEKGKLNKGGKLQALVIKGEKSRDTRNWDAQPFAVGNPVEVEWIDLENVDAPDDDLRHRGFEKGAARFARGEGMWHGDDEIYFACTSGGKSKTGQIFKYIPSKFEGTDKEADMSGKLELFVEPNDTDLLRHCDNLTVAPNGHVVFVEDTSHPRIVGITPDGKFYHLGENVGYKSEMAGVVFSPSGKTLFVNIQHVGLTLAITGPWKS